MNKYFDKIKKYIKQHRLPLIFFRVLKELRLVDHDFNLSYSQEGEDLILGSYLLRNKQQGFYVDIGANHPKKFSSTYLFYLNGWQGLAVDPWPEAKKLFAKYRPHDIFVNCGVADKDDVLDYYCFRSSLMNTFKTEEAEALKNDPDEGCRSLGVKKIKVRQLRDILNEYDSFIGSSRIDFMNIDVEGGELEVLSSNDWNKYLPGFIAVEIHDFDLSKVNDFAVHNYLLEKNYSLIAKTQLTAIYKHKFYEI
jgi:FkbM family methyltransferase